MRKKGNKLAEFRPNSSKISSIQTDVKVDFEVRESKYDDSNPLVLPSKKTKQEKRHGKPAQPPKKVLSKKQRKKLEKVLEKKKRKINRAELFEKLSKVQATPEEIDVFASTSQMQTLGKKRFKEHISSGSANKRKISSIKGFNKRQKRDSEVCESESSTSSSSESEIECSVESPNQENPELSEQNGSVPEKTSENQENSNMNNEEQVLESNSIAEPKIKTVCTSSVFVSVTRKPEIQAVREALPIYSEEQAIMETIKENSVLILHGETGSGKTTQVPQFLYEAGFTRDGKLIGITEPRRIAAMTMSARVGEELNSRDLVSYHIRYKKTVDEKTEIKFMTDGVLLKEIRQDFYLSRYSAIIIDEAHERSVFSDVLIGLLSRIVPLRLKKGDPLKLIVMSATIRVEDFTENPHLFKEPPVLIKVASRQYKVDVHFSVQTPSDYVDAAYHKVCKIHRQLPPGAILVFLTGENEIKRLCRMLEKTFAFKSKHKKSLKEKKSQSESIEERKPEPPKKKQEQNELFSALPVEINLDNYSTEPLDSENLQHQISDDEGDTNEEYKFTEPSFESSSPLYTLPLYSMLPFHDQNKVFSPPPEGSRLCVVATNVAETSITIPGLKYVVDSGKVKTKLYDRTSGGISKFVITWCSKASANQRAGRCGRTEGGHCYRLYSSAVFNNDLPDFSLPEIQRIPVDDVLLQMKALGITKVVDFPFPSPPDKEALKAAEKRLVLFGALENMDKFKDVANWEFSAKVTDLGKAMSHFPLSPRYAKMLLLSYKHACMPYMIAIVSGMSVPNVFSRSPTAELEASGGEESADSLINSIKSIGVKKGKALLLGDAMVLLQAVAVFAKSRHSRKFCLKNGLHLRAMLEIQKMCFQLLREVNRAFTNLSLPLNMELDPPSDDVIEILRKIVACGFTDHVAKKLPREKTKDDKDLKNAYQCLDLSEPVFIHPSSILFDKLPEFVVYQEITHTSKYYMKGVVEIEVEWISKFSPCMCDFSPPLEDPPPSYDQKNDKIVCSMNATIGRWQWEVQCRGDVEMPAGLLKYKWFSCFLLDGQICKQLKAYTPLLLSKPDIMLKSWAKLQPRTQFLLHALIDKEVDSRKKLEGVWKDNPKYLLREYREWLPPEQSLEIELKWPPFES